MSPTYAAGVASTCRPLRERPGSLSGTIIIVKNVSRVIEPATGAGSAMRIASSSVPQDTQLCAVVISSENAPGVNGFHSRLSPQQWVGCNTRAMGRWKEVSTGSIFPNLAVCTFWGDRTLFVGEVFGCEIRNSIASQGVLKRPQGILGTTAPSCPDIVSLQLHGGDDKSFFFWRAGSE